ncbi:MAG: uridine kinase [Myxococcota bacterium]
MVIGIAGGTASGKTTVARLVADRLGDRCLLVAHDRYYHPASRPGPRPRNYDHPDALDTELLIADLARLRAGQPTQLPVYDFARHDRRVEADWDRVEPRPVVIVEGILVLALGPLREVLDLRVYVDAPDDLRLMRRIRRDLAERGRGVHDVLDQYEGTVRPMHDQFVVPSRGFADLVIDGTAPPDHGAEALLAHLDARR